MAVSSEVIPDLNLKSRDSGIPTKINPGIPENREKFPGFPKIGNFPGFPGNRDSRKLDDGAKKVANDGSICCLFKNVLSF